MGKKGQDFKEQSSTASQSKKRNSQAKGKAAPKAKGKAKGKAKAKGAACKEDVFEEGDLEHADDEGENVGQDDECPGMKEQAPSSVSATETQDGGETKPGQNIEAEVAAIQEQISDARRASAAGFMGTPSVFCNVGTVQEDGGALPNQQFIFFVRHAESRWNRAQDGKDLVGMYKEKDHGISEKGRGQAEELRQLIKQCTTSASTDDDMTAKFKTPGVIFVSPLTRAIQTAVIALRDLLMAGHGEFVILKAAREKKGLGGADSAGVAVGSDIKGRVQQDLHGLYPEDERIQDRIRKRQSLLTAVEGLQLDVSDVQEQWWDSVVESKTAFRNRLDEFLSQIRACRKKHVIVVGHSHFFRCFFRIFLSQPTSPERRLSAVNGSGDSGKRLSRVSLDAQKIADAQSQKVRATKSAPMNFGKKVANKIFGSKSNSQTTGDSDDLVALLQKYKIPNCGVIGMRIAWKGNSPTVEELAPILGTQMKEDPEDKHGMTNSLSNVPTLGDIIKEGELKKLSASTFQGWQRRKFRLHKYALLFSSPDGWDPKDKQCIPLTNILSITCEGRDFELGTDMKPYKLRAHSDEAVHEWIDAINLAMRHAKEASEFSYDAANAPGLDQTQNPSDPVIDADPRGPVAAAAGAPAASAAEISIRGGYPS